MGNYLIIIYILIAIAYKLSAYASFDLEDNSLIFSKEEDTDTTNRFTRSDGVQQFSTRPMELVTIKKDTKHIGLKSKSRNNAYSKSFDDNYWEYQWFAHDQRTVLGPVMDHNLVPVYWMGYRGEGIVVGVIGDGVQRGLDDLQNVKKPESLIPNRIQGEPSSNRDGKVNSEATKMAGVIAMNANNSICGVGVAFNSKIVGNVLVIMAMDSEPLFIYGYGIRLWRNPRKVLDFEFADVITYDKFMWKDDYVYGLDDRDNVLCDIYTLTIGRPDDGTFMKQSTTITSAFKDGVAKGRKGKGSIYVVGAGDGKTSGHDNCAADDFVNDLNTIAIASADHRGKVTPYSERCAAVMATAYSSDDDEAIVTTDVGGACTRYYTGNKPSVGIAAGIFALLLQSNPQLTARDVQHLVVMTSEVAPLVDNPGTWTLNKAGFYVSNDFGFGLLNAENLVIKAEKWISPPPLEDTEADFTFTMSNLEPGKLLTGTVKVATDIKYMEQIELISSVKLKQRGSLSMNLTSAAGTKVVILEERLRDLSSWGLIKWRIKTGHFWGENPAGPWTLTASIALLPEDPKSCGLHHLFQSVFEHIFKTNIIENIKLVIHGTKIKPEHYLSSGQARTYSAFYNKELDDSKQLRNMKYTYWAYMSGPI